jgi:DNA-binding response OmpR family regulator
MMYKIVWEQIMNTLMLHFIKSGEIAQIPLKDHLMIGMGDSQNGQHLNLAAYGGEQFGVSGQHAKLTVMNSRLVVEDMSTREGTYLNGERLAPHDQRQLKHGDVLAFGALEAEVALQVDNNGQRSSIMATRETIVWNTNPKQGNKQRVLIVDDEEAITTLLRLVLSRAGYEVLVCNDVVSAIRIVNQHAPTLVTLDLRFAGVHGLELCRYIRRDAAHPNTPIVVISAMTNAESIKQAIDAGVDVFIGKPINQGELQLVISTLIERAEAGTNLLTTKQLDRNMVRELHRKHKEKSLALYVEGRREMEIVVEDEVTLGRQNNQQVPGKHINLDPFGAFEKGVSRLHARLRRVDDRFYIENLNSTNGVSVNGLQLDADGTRLLKSGDELFLGRLAVRVFRVDDGEFSA